MLHACRACNPRKVRVAALGAPVQTLRAQALDEERQMREYRAQLDADRAAKLSKGTNHADLRGALDDAKGKVCNDQIMQTKAQCNGFILVGCSALEMLQTCSC